MSYLPLTGVMLIDDYAFGSDDAYVDLRCHWERKRADWPASIVRIECNDTPGHSLEWTECRLPSAACADLEKQINAELRASEAIDDEDDTPAERPFDPRDREHAANVREARS